MNEFLDFVLKQVKFVENPPPVQPDFLIHSLAHLPIFCLKAIAKCLLSPWSERTFWLTTASRFRLSLIQNYFSLLFFVLCLVELPKSPEHVLLSNLIHQMLSIDFESSIGKLCFEPEFNKLKSGRTRLKVSLNFSEVVSFKNRYQR